MNDLRLLLYSVMAVLALGSSRVAFAQTDTGGSTTDVGTTTEIDPRWTGADISTFKLDTQDQTDPTRFFLYNVGTGKFIVAGGGWGIQAMLYYQDFGTYMTLSPIGTDSYYIRSGFQNPGVDAALANCFGVNYPQYTSGSDKWGDSNVFGPMFEARESGNFTVNSTITKNYSISWKIERVGNDKNGVYTYYLTETVKTDGADPKTFYIGSVRGVDPETGKDDSYVGVNYVTFSEKEKYHNQDSLCYQWRFVTLEQAEDALEDASADSYGGLNYNISYYVHDPFFNRNRSAEFKDWVINSTATDSVDNQGQTILSYRYDWNWKNVDRDKDEEYKDYKNTDKSGASNYEKNDGRIYFDSPWNKARFRKPQFDNKADGNYSYGLFEGVGTVSQHFTAPVEGWYQVEVRGFYQGNPAKVYISDGTTTKESTLKEESGFGKYTTSNNVIVPDNSALLRIGKTLFDNANGQYTTTVNIKVAKGATVTFGFSKDKATQQQGFKGPARTFYFDSDIAAVDNVNLYYLGKEQPFVYDEDETSTDYITKIANLSTDDKAAYQNVSTFLHRTFTLGKWNSLVLPINITTAQARQAFGDDVKIARLNGVGTITKGQSCIDFKSVPLPAEGIAILAGQMYIIKPTLGPTSTVTLNSGTETKLCYAIGRRNIDGTLVDPQGVDGESSQAPGVPNVHYQGTYITLAADNSNAPQAGSYVFSGGDMYHITKAFAIKGFRGWLTDIEGTAPVKGYSIDSFLDNTATFIDGVRDNVDKKTDDRIYTISGQMVGRGDMNGLPSGLYIIGGKKVLVK